MSGRVPFALLVTSLLALVTILTVYYDGHHFISESFLPPGGNVKNATNATAAVVSPSSSLSSPQPTMNNITAPPTAAPVSEAVLSKAKPITFYIELNTAGGLGNKISGLIGMLAMARAADRRVAVSGPSVIWRDFWESSFEYARPPPDSAALRCSMTQLKTPDSNCQRALFEKPNTVMVAVTTASHGDPYEVLDGLLPFPDKYVAAVRAADEHAVFDDLLKMPQFSPSVFKAIEFLMELSSILYKPTAAFHQFMQDFLAKHALSTVDDDGNLFDLALHIRKCVDCGWIMTESQVQQNVQCAFQTYAQSPSAKPWNETKVFVTSDDHKVLDWIRPVFPEGVMLFEQIPEKLIHTDIIKANAAHFNALAMPYLDNYFLGKSRYVGSCWTSFGQMGALRRTDGLARLDTVLIWSHHNKSSLCTRLSGERAIT